MMAATKVTAPPVSNFPGSPVRVPAHSMAKPACMRKTSEALNIRSVLFPTSLRKSKSEYTVKRRTPPLSLPPLVAAWVMLDLMRLLMSLTATPFPSSSAHSREVHGEVYKPVDRIRFDVAEDQRDCLDHVGVDVLYDRAYVQVAAFLIGDLVYSVDGLCDIRHRLHVDTVEGPGGGRALKTKGGDEVLRDVPGLRDSRDVLRGEVEVVEALHLGEAATREGGRVRKLHGPAEPVVKITYP